MADPEANASEAAVKEEELIRLLAQASSALGRLRDRATRFASLADPVAAGFCPSELRTLCAILDHGRGRIDRRLAILKAGAQVAPADSDPPCATADPLSFMAEYRGCCRLLCRALNEALRIPNAAAGSMLSDFILQLEKQLWLMDSPKQDSGPDRYRSVSLFLTC
jgi:hypothetical protein